jgi:hypothetical protein
MWRLAVLSLLISRRPALIPMRLPVVVNLLPPAVELLKQADDLERAVRQDDNAFALVLRSVFEFRLLFSAAHADLTSSVRFERLSNDI